MKERYVEAEIKLILLDFCDIITTSDPNGDGPIIVEGPIGGGGYDPNGWT